MFAMFNFKIKIWLIKIIISNDDDGGGLLEEKNAKKDYV